MEQNALKNVTIVGIPKFPLS